MLYTVISVNYKDKGSRIIEYDSQELLISYLRDYIVDDHDNFNYGDDYQNDLDVVYGMNLQQLIDEALNLTDQIIGREEGYGIIAIIKGGVLYK